MPISPKPSQPNFDRVAPIYQLAEYLTLGPLLQRTRTALLDEISRHLQPRQALVLGDGDGRFLAQLLLRYPTCNALAVDTCAAMLNRLRRRALRRVPNAATRLTTLHQSALTLDPTTLPAKPDLITTHFFLDCLTQPELDTLVARLAPQLTPGSLWLLSDFALPTRPILRPFGALYIRALYLAFRLLTGLARHPPARPAIRSPPLRPPPHRPPNLPVWPALHRALATRVDSNLPRRNLHPARNIHPSMSSPPQPRTPFNAPARDSHPDAQPDPEPPAPTLPEPDPGVFHHEPTTPTKPGHQQEKAHA